MTGAVGNAARGAANTASGAAGWAADKARESWYGALATAYSNWYGTKDKTRQASHRAAIQLTLSPVGRSLRIDLGPRLCLRACWRECMQPEAGSGHACSLHLLGN